ncbi:hypothetical protein CK203_043584 [Vitis vinifera]|uniref:Uncharacterized protein n=1 Tax=Vitis vinifera TaxID=29760 RepID=A0A438HYJ9_VITVI|nr:hypothetical protein CK203_043584 [Vitis vinifera]
MEESKRKKDDTFDEVAIPVIEKIDKLLKESQENGRSVSGSNDILVEHWVLLSIVVELGQGSTTHLAEVLAKLSQVGAITPQSDVSSSNMKQKKFLLPEVVEKPIRRGEDATPPVPIEPKNKVRKCELAMETKENIVGGTIILECGPNYLVVVDALMIQVHPFPFLFLDKLLLLGLQLVTKFLVTHLVIIHTPISTSKKGKKQKENEVEVKSKDDVFGESFKTFLMKEDMDMIISSKEVSSNCILYYICIVSKAGMGEGSKENRSRVIADRLRNAKHAEYMLIPYNPE